MECTFETLQNAGLLPANLNFRDPDTLQAMAAANDLVRVLLTNTVALTTMGAGRKHNVIPSHAQATLDCRLLPGEDMDAFLAYLRDIIADDGIQLDVVYRDDPLVSEIRTELLDHVEATIREETDGAIVLPLTSPGFTDSRIYRRHGVPAVGYVPVLLSSDDFSTVHGHNEKISCANLRLGTQLLLDTVRRAAGP